MGQGQELRHVCSDWPMAGHERRDHSTTEPGLMVGGGWRPLPKRQYQYHGLRCCIPCLLYKSVHVAAVGRSHFYRYSAGRWTWAETNTGLLASGPDDAAGHHWARYSAAARSSCTTLVSTSAMNQLDLNNRVAIVTGSARGIGYSIAERMLRSGASVALWDVDTERLRR